MCLNKETYAINSLIFIAREAVSPLAWF